MPKCRPQRSNWNDSWSKRCSFREYGPALLMSGTVGLLVFMVSSGGDVSFCPKPERPPFPRAGNPAAS